MIDRAEQSKIPGIGMKHVVRAHSPGKGWKAYDTWDRLATYTDTPTMREAAATAVSTQTEPKYGGSLELVNAGKDVYGVHWSIYRTSGGALLHVSVHAV